MSNIIVVFAVEGEEIYIPNVMTIVTGIGKARASYALTKCLMEQPCDLVLNVGTVGTLKHHIGDIIVSNCFVDRDYEKLRAYGVEWQLISDKVSFLSLPSLLDGKESYKTMVVNTGEDFVTAGSQILGDVVDMEAFALAYVCRQFGVPMISVKYVTDIIGSNSLKLWEDKLSEARLALSDYFKRYLNCL